MSCRIRDGKEQTQVSCTVLDDERMSVFHSELMETCIDMMARYTFSSNTNMPERYQRYITGRRSLFRDMFTIDVPVSYHYYLEPSAYFISYY